MINQIEMQAVSGNDRNHVGQLTVNVYKNITATVMYKISIPLLLEATITAMLLDILFTDFYNCLQFN